MAFNSIDKKIWYRHRGPFTLRNQKRCYNPFTKCKISGNRLFLKKCLHLEVHIPSLAKYSGGPITDIYKYYVDEGAYMLERLTLPSPDEPMIMY